MSELIQEQQKQVQKQLHKASDVFLNATEKQCSYYLAMEGKEGKEFCAVGLLGLYSGKEPTMPVTGLNGEKSFGFPIMTNISELYKFYGIDSSEIHKCPECEQQIDMCSLLPHLNNKPRDNPLECGFNKNAHGWTFKQIGQWLQKQGY